ncbi:MAG: YjgP/YjgQ family permease [Chlorobium limicola]|uniref:LptF/LptG family permease n=1 Tax=Chlorobium limicola TaxID=1092 RepID=UPI0023F2DAFB|nr:LptF/LptG family permease [Chlorobium limicola]NTV21786.1 YjgP/YjgQ family permease [Chlorobium limicola]
MKIIDRYILKSHIGPFILAFITIVFVLVLQFLAGFSDRFLGKGINIADIAELVMLQSAWMVVFAVPMAVLVAVIMAYGTMTNASEMTVFRASGLSLYRLAVPVLIVAALLSLLVERFNNVVIPEANYRSKSLMMDIARAKPTFGLTENAFSSFIDGYSIFVRKTDEASKEIRGVVLYDLRNPKSRTMMSAERGVIRFSPDNRFLVMTLFNGEIHQIDQSDYHKYRAMRFGQHRLVFETTGFGFSRTSNDRIRGNISELSAGELHVAASALQRGIVSAERRVASITDAGPLQREQERIEADKMQYNKYLIEYYKKYAISVACFVFALAGIPLGVLARRGGFGVGAGISLALFVLYWSMIIGGEKIAERGLLDPVLSVWSANAVTGLFGLFLLHRMSGTVLRTSK